MCGALARVDVAQGSYQPNERNQTVTVADFED